MLIGNDYQLIHTVVGGFKNPKSPNAAFKFDHSTMTVDGVFLLRKYKMIYQIEEAGNILQKKVEFVRTGQEVIDDLSMISGNFSQIYEGSSRDYLFALRGCVRNIVTVNATLEIKGRSNETIRQLRKSASFSDEIMKDMKTSSWQMFYTACLGAYMFFHIKSSDTLHNTYTLTDVQSMSKSDIDRYLSRVNRDSPLFRLHGEDEIRKRLQFGQIRCQSSFENIA
jgi:hypothetical protein